MVAEAIGVAAYILAVAVTASTILRTWLRILERK